MDSRKEIRRGGLCALMYMLATVIGALVLSGSRIPVNFGVGFCALAACFIIMLAGKKSLPIREIFKKKQNMSFRSFLIILGAFSILKLLGLVITILLAMVTGLNDIDAGAIIGEKNGVIDTVASVFALSIVTPFCEEVVFRGAVAKRFTKHGMVFALIASSLFFSVFHGNVVQLISTFLLGLCFFYITGAYGIWYSILFHFINNCLLGDVLTALTKGNAFLSNYGMFLLLIILSIVGIIVSLKSGSKKKVREFLAAPKNEKGAYKSALLSPAFIIMCIIVIIQSAVLIFGLETGSFSM